MPVSSRELFKTSRFLVHTPDFINQNLLELGPKNLTTIYSSTDGTNADHSGPVWGLCGRQMQSYWVVHHPASVIKTEILPLGKNIDLKKKALALAF